MVTYLEIMQSGATTHAIVEHMSWIPGNRKSVTIWEDRIEWARPQSLPMGNWQASRIG